jgi:hypothetical protein
LIVAIGACSPAVPDDETLQRSGAFLPIHKPMIGGPAAIIGGVLRERDGCLVFENESGVDLPLWPPGTAAWIVDGVTVVSDLDGRVAARVGDAVSFGGGTDYPLDWAEDQVGPIPVACRVGNYTLVNSLEALAQPD